MNCRTDFIPQYFEHNVTFDTKTKLDVQIYDKGLSQVILKFVLPKLPASLKYKTICAYDLIKKITLRVGGNIFFKHNSKHLALLDAVERNFRDLHQIISVDDNQVLYPIDLSIYFGKCNTESKQLNDCIRLLDCKKCKIVFEIKIGSIVDIVQNNNEYLNYNDEITSCENIYHLDEELRDLDILDAMAYVSYSEPIEQNNDTLWFDKIFTNQNNTIIHNAHNWIIHNIVDQYLKPEYSVKQKNVNWHGDEIKIHRNDQPRTHHFHDIGNNMNVSKIIIYSTMLHFIDKFTINITDDIGKRYSTDINPSEFRKIINYNSNFTLVNYIGINNSNPDFVDDSNILFFNLDCNKNQKISFDILLSKPIENFVLDYMYKTYNEIIYHDEYLEIIPQ